MAFVASVTFAAPAFAQDGNSNNNRGFGNGDHRMMPGKDKPGMRIGQMKPAVLGTVTGINGTTLTVTGHAFGITGQAKDLAKAASTTFSVNAASATVFKNNATTTLASIALNDRVLVQGTINGTSVTAVTIHDGYPGQGKIRKPEDVQPPVKGTGQPVVAGTVSAVSGSMVTITTSSNTTFSIDASNAKITKSGSASSVSAIAVGDYLVVQGSVNGSSVTAATITNGKVNPVLQFLKGIFGF